MSKKKPVIIRKYANRRLYNTEISSYVTLEDLCQMVKDGAEFIVYDAKTGEDLTKAVLVQIIFEQESGGANMLTTDFLRRVISFYDDSLKSVVPQYLDAMMHAFSKNQDEVRKYLSRNKSFNPFRPLEDVYKAAWGRQNMDIFTKAFDMFSGFAAPSRNTKKDKK